MTTIVSAMREHLAQEVRTRPGPAPDWDSGALADAVLALPDDNPALRRCAVRGRDPHGPRGPR